MKVIGTTNIDISCIWTTIGKSIEQFGKNQGLETIIYDRSDFLARRIEPTNDEVLFIFEAGTPQHAGYTMDDMKRIYPNSKFIALSSDAVVYKRRHYADQLNYGLVDILMEVEDEAIEHYTKKYQGLIGEKFLWTASDWLIEQATNFYKSNILNKSNKYDFILVAILGGDYRGRLVTFLNDFGYTITNGGGNGHHDNDLNRLFSYYMNSAVTLGTTSHNDPQIRGMKGFRDWIGPILGAPLIYDNYPQVIKAYGTSVIYYDYDSLPSIIDTYKYVTENNTLKYSIIESQKQWLMENTIEKQLERVCKKHGIL